MRIRKRIGAWALVLCLLLGMIPTYASAATVDSGTCGDNVTWVLDDSGTLTISGTGPMTDYDGSEGQPWHENSANINTLVIESGVTSIGSSAFLGCGALTSLIISDSVTSIGNNAFWNCDGLTSLEIPDHVVSIDYNAFGDCAGLTSVTIPKSVTSLGYNPFSNCPNLTEILVSSENSAYSSDNGALFNYDKTRFIGYPAGKSETAYVIPNGVTYLGIHAFSGCGNLTDVTLPDSVTDIDNYAFNGCNALRDVYYGGLETQWGAVTIGNNNTPLTNATIHYNSSGGETPTDSDTLSGTCGDNLTWTLVNGTLTVSGTGAMTNYDTASAAPWNDYRASITSATFESGVTSVGSHALNACANLTAVSLPNGLTTVGYSAFRDCTSLTGVALPDTVTTIGGDAFRGCSALADMRIPSGVTLISDNAFLNCANLRAVRIPTSVTSVGSYAFSGCGGLTDVYYQGTAQEWGNIYVDDGNEALSSATMHYNDENGDWNGSSTTVTSVMLNPSTVTLDGTNGATAQASAIGSDGNSITSGVSWSVTPANSGVTIHPTSGTIAVASHAPAGDYTVTATYNNVSHPTTLTVSRNVTLASVALNPSTVALDGTNGASVTATAIGSDNNAFTGGVTWSVTPSGSGVEIADETSGTIAVAADATAQDYTVTATYNNVSQSATLTVSRTVTFSSVTVTPSTVALDGTNGATAQATAIGSDGNSITSGVTWSVAPLNGGVTIDATSGAIAIAADATAQDYTVTATYNNVNHSTTLTVSRTVTVTLDHITLNPSTVVLDGTNGATVTATGIGSDNNPMTSGTVLWSLSPTDNGVTMFPDNGYMTIEVAANATAGDYTVTAVYNDTITRTATLTVTRNPSYIVTFYGNGGAPDTITVAVASGETVPTPAANPTRDGYEFTGWYTDPQATTAFDFTTPITANMTLYAGWRQYDIPVYYTVTFEANGGTNTMPPVTVSGNSYTLPQCGFTPPEGMRFKEWRFSYYDESSGISGSNLGPVQPGEGIPIYGNTTVTAQWISVEILAQGECGDNLTWILTRDGTLTISGMGSMSDYSAAAPAPWYAYRQSIRAAVLESGVGSVGAYAFGDCSALSALTLPNSVGTVAPHAFDGCAVLETVSYDGTQEQWDAVIFSTAYNDALEFATVRCGDETYNAYRTLGFFGTDGRMEAASEQTWRFPVPLARFRNLFIDVEDAENAPDGTELVRKASTGELSHAEGSREYAATSGSTILTIPQETFETFQEGSHSITATFQDSRQATRTTSNVYTIFPTGPIDINEAELTARAVEDVSYTGRLQTTPKLSDKFYRFNITAATRDGETLTITRRSGEDTENETANDVQQIDAQAFYFHPNGRFSGIPTTPGTYELTVELQVRREINDDWYTPEGEQDNPRVVTIVVEEKNANNIAFTSEGYEVVQEPPATIEQGTPFQMAVTKDPEDRLTAVYLDSELLVENQDYTISTQIIQAPRLLDGGILTQLAINVTKTNIGVGLHSLNLEFEHVDSLGNTQTKNVARPLTVTARRAVTPVNTISSGSSGGSSRSTTPTVTTYTVKVSKPSHGTLTLSATKVAAGKSVTITATPNSGYQTASVSVVDSQKKAVQTSRDGNKYTFTMPKRSVTVSASFTLSTYSLTASQAQHGQVSLNRSTAAPGATINGTTTPDKGYLLSSVAVRDANGRSVNVETFNDGKFTFLMPSGRVTVSATFTVKRLASFVDIQGPDWFFDDAEWAYNKSILRGMNETYWEPQSLMSSVTSIVTLERLDGVDLTPYDTGADDGIDNSAWYASAQRWARDNHILLQDRPFGERDPMTRGECAVMLTNYLRYRGLKVTPKSESTFTDADQLTPDELNAFRLLQDADVFRGYGDGTIRPKAYLSRAHLSALLHRLSTYIIREETGGI